MADTLYGTGKRKNAIARVWLTPGNGTISVNGKTVEEYFPRIAHQQHLRSPLTLTGEQTFDIKAFAKGGGVSGQQARCVTASPKPSCFSTKSFAAICARLAP